MVYLCNSIAAVNPLVTVEVIDADAFPELISRHKVGQVPKVLINDGAEVLDVIPAAELIARIAAATAPPRGGTAITLSPTPIEYCSRFDDA